MKLRWHDQKLGSRWSHLVLRRGVCLTIAALLGGLCTATSMAQSRVELGVIVRTAPPTVKSAGEAPAASEPEFLSIPSMGFALSAEGAVFDMVGVPGSARLSPLSIDLPRGSDAHAIAAAGSTVVLAERHRALLRFYRRMPNGAAVHSQLEIAGRITSTALSAGGSTFALAVSGEDVIRVVTLSGGRAAETSITIQMDGAAEVASLQVSNDASLVAVAYARGDRLEVYEIRRALLPRYVGAFERQAQMVIPGSGGWLAVYEPDARRLSRYSSGTLVEQGQVAGDPAKRAATAKLVDIGGSPMLLEATKEGLVACGADQPCHLLAAAVGQIAHAGALAQYGLTGVVPADPRRPIYVLEQDRQGNLAAHFVARE